MSSFLKRLRSSSLSPLVSASPAGQTESSSGKKVDKVVVSLNSSDEHDFDFVDFANPSLCVAPRKDSKSDNSVSARKNPTPKVFATPGKSDLPMASTATGSSVETVPGETETQDGAVSVEGGGDDSVADDDVGENPVWDEMFVNHSRLADQAIGDMVRIVEETEGWVQWEKKDNLKIEKKTLECGAVQGRSTMTWTETETATTTDENLFDFVADYIWDIDAKKEYDEGAMGMLLLKEYKGRVPDYGIVHQAFKGKFGIAGRDFIVVTTRRLEEDAETRRCVIGAVSVPDDEKVVELITDEKLRESYETLRKGLVRATATVAGFVLDYNKKSAQYSLVYVNDADLKTKGIPKWLVTRAKLEQLRVVSKVPQCLVAARERARQQEEAAEKNEIEK